MNAYPADYPKADKGSPLDKVYRALWRSGSSYDSGQDWQCPAHDDNRASLGVREGDQQPVVLFCQAGCETATILNAIGLSWADAMLDTRGIKAAKAKPSRSEGGRGSLAKSGGSSTTVDRTPKHRHDDNCDLINSRVWWYTDAEGNRISGVRRLDYGHEPHKDIRQLRGNREDPTTPAKLPYVLYRLGDVLEQCRRGGRIVLVEGEPGVDAAIEAGWETKRKGSNRRSMIVTTMRSGAGKTIAWRDSYTESLSGASEVVIVADRDLAGMRHAKLVLGKMKAAGINARVVASATHDKHDDLVEHIAAGYGFIDLERLSARALDELITDYESRVDPEELAGTIDAAEFWPNPGEPRKVAMKFRELNFRDDQGHELLKFWRGDFYAWNGSFWYVIPTEEIESALEEKLHSAKTVNKDGEPVNFTLTHSRVRDIMHFLERLCYAQMLSEPPFWLDGSHEDSPKFISLRNGNLNIDTRELVDHSPMLFNINALPFDYKEKARCPEWQAFLQSIWPDDSKSVRLLQECFGLLVSGETKYEKIIMLVGPPRSGKGTIGFIIRKILGDYSVAAPQLKQLANNFGLQPLIGKSVAIVGDARFSGNNGSEVVAQLLSVSGSDTVTVDRKNRDAWTGQLPTRFVIMSNEPPNLRDSAGAFAQRLLMLRMVESFIGREDFELRAKLHRELAGIFNWALDGLDRLRKREAESDGTASLFTRPARSVAAEREMVRITSPVTAFVQDMCSLAPEFKVAKQDVWEEWQIWARENGVFAGSNIVFGRDLISAFPDKIEAAYARTVQAKGMTRSHDTTGGFVRKPIYKGIRLNGEQR